MGRKYFFFWRILFRKFIILHDLLDRVRDESIFYALEKITPFFRMFTKHLMVIVFYKITYLYFQLKSKFIYLFTERIEEVSRVDQSIGNYLLHLHFVVVDDDDVVV